MLRWTHDHHRDFRSLESAQGAAAAAKPNREDAFVTRHGLHHTRAAATARRPMAQLVPNGAHCLSTACFDHHSRVRNRHAAAPSHTTASRTSASDKPLPASATKQIPHRPSARRGFVHPGLSYAFGARNSSGFATVRLRVDTRWNQTLGLCLTRRLSAIWSESCWLGEPDWPQACISLVPCQPALRSPSSMWS